MQSNKSTFIMKVLLHDPSLFILKTDTCKRNNALFPLCAQVVYVSEKMWYNHKIRVCCAVLCTTSIRNYTIFKVGEVRRLDDLNRNVAANLRRLRRSKQMSLDGAARETGLSKSMLGQIERGEANPTLSTLEKIMSGLRVSFMDLVSPLKESAYLVRRDSLVPVKEEPNAYSSVAYFPYEQDRSFALYEITVEPGKVYHCSAHGARTAAFLVVVSGRLLLETEGKNYRLCAGDAIRFCTDCAHRYFCEGAERLRLFLVLYWT